MDPLTLGVVAGVGYILLRGKASAAAGDANLSIEALAAKYVGKPVNGTPAAVNARFVDWWNQVRASGKEGWVIHGITPEENARLGPDWHYLIGRLPGPFDRNVGWITTPQLNLVWRRTSVKEKESGLGGLVRKIGTVGGGVVGGVFGGPGGAAAGSRIGGLF